MLTISTQQKISFADHVRRMKQAKVDALRQTTPGLELTESVEQLIYDFCMDLALRQQNIAAKAVHLRLE